jgi:hypothetical protein
VLFGRIARLPVVPTVAVRSPFKLGPSFSIFGVSLDSSVVSDIIIADNIVSITDMNIVIVVILLLKTSSLEVNSTYSTG